MSITHEEDLYTPLLRQIEELARVIDAHAFDVELFTEEAGKDFHLPKNIYWANRRETAKKLAGKIIAAGYKK